MNNSLTLEFWYPNSAQFSCSVVSDSLWPHKPAGRQASLSITNSQSLLKLMSIESVMPSSHLILCRSLLPLPQVPPSIRVFSNESTLHMMWPKYWSFSFIISPSKEHSGPWIFFHYANCSHALDRILFQEAIWWFCVFLGFFPSLEILRSLNSRATMFSSQET